MYPSVHLSTLDGQDDLVLYDVPCDDRPLVPLVGPKIRFGMGSLDTVDLVQCEKHIRIAQDFECRDMCAVVASLFPL